MRADARVGVPVQAVGAEGRALPRVARVRAVPRERPPELVAHARARRHAVEQPRVLRVVGAEDGVVGVDLRPPRPAADVVPATDHGAPAEALRVHAPLNRRPADGRGAVQVRRRAHLAQELEERALHVPRHVGPLGARALDDPVLVVAVAARLLGVHQRPPQRAHARLVGAREEGRLRAQAAIPADELADVEGERAVGDRRGKRRAHLVPQLGQGLAEQRAHRLPRQHDAQHVRPPVAEDAHLAPPVAHNVQQLGWCTVH